LPIQSHCIAPVGDTISCSPASTSYFFVTVWFVFPETKGKTLEEIAIVFENPATSHATRFPDPEKIVEFENTDHLEKVGASNEIKGSVDK
jgi:hypothetical protein